MAKYYLEIREQLSEEERLIKQPQEFRKEYNSEEEAKAAGWQKSAACANIWQTAG